MSPGRLRRSGTAAARARRTPGTRGNHRGADTAASAVTGPLTTWAED